MIAPDISSPLTRRPADGLMAGPRAWQIGPRPTFSDPFSSLRPERDGRPSRRRLLDAYYLSERGEERL